MPRNRDGALRDLLDLALEEEGHETARHLLDAAEALLDSPVVAHAGARVYRSRTSREPQGVRVCSQTGRRLH